MQNNTLKAALQKPQRITSVMSVECTSAVPVMLVAVPLTISEKDWLFCVALDRLRSPHPVALQSNRPMTHASLDLQCRRPLPTMSKGSRAAHQTKPRVEGTEWPNANTGVRMLSVRATDPMPGITCAGEKVAVAPAGKPLTLILITPVNGPG